MKAALSMYCTDLTPFNGIERYSVKLSAIEASEGVEWALGGLLVLSGLSGLSSLRGLKGLRGLRGLLGVERLEGN